jgi:hypothetical protein
LCRQAPHIADDKIETPFIFVPILPRLTAEEFSSLKEVGNRPVERTIPDDRDRLIKIGYIREVVRYDGSLGALALTGRGLSRLALGQIDRQGCSDYSNGWPCLNVQSRYTVIFVVCQSR